MRPEASNSFSQSSWERDWKRKRKKSPKRTRVKWLHSPSGWLGYFWNLENCLCIIQALLCNAEGVELDRITFKFKENEGEKIKLVADIFKNHKKRLQEFELKNTETEEDPQLQILKKLDNGLFHMQQCTYILSKLVTSSNEEVIAEFVGDSFICLN